MNWTLLIDYIFGPLKFEFVLAFYVFAILGMAITLLLHLRDSRNRCLKAGKKFKFNFRFWLRDNTLRIVINLLFIFVLLRFYESLHLNYKLDMFLGFAVGLSIDTFIIFIREKTPINIFQSMKSKELSEDKP